MNKLIVGIILFFGELLVDLGKWINLKGDTLILKSKQTCNHKNKKATLFESLKFEFTAGYKCKDCGTVLRQPVSESDKAALYCDFFEADSVTENDPEWISLKNDGGFNV